MHSTNTPETRVDGHQVFEAPSILVVTVVIVVEVLAIVVVVVLVVVVAL